MTLLLLNSRNFAEVGPTTGGGEISLKNVPNVLVLVNVFEKFVCTHWVM